MKKLYLSESTISQAFWNSLRQSGDYSLAKEDAEFILRQTKIVHQRFPQDVAGSISLDATIMLWLIARYFAPKHIFEVGTFIGRSTLALAIGAGESLERLDTCDFSFDLFGVTESVKSKFDVVRKINYWPKTSSGDALKKIISKNMRPDFIFLDGRLGDEDLNLISKLDRTETIFVIDDFEGLEKGVANAITLRKNFPELLLIRPEVSESESIGNTGLLVHPKLIAITRQQKLPIRMQ